jgi:hypothetical protein
MISRLIRDESCEIPNPGDPEAMAFTFLLESEVEEEKFFMNPILIQKEQEKDKKLQKEIQKNSNKYIIRTIEGAKLVTYKRLIVIPRSLQQRIVAWYHHYLAHRSPYCHGSPTSRDRAYSLVPTVRYLYKVSGAWVRKMRWCPVLCLGDGNAILITSVSSQVTDLSADLTDVTNYTSFLP